MRATSSEALEWRALRVRDAWAMLGVMAMLMAMSGQIGCQSATTSERHMEAAAMPELRKVGGVTQLYVAGQPYLALGGELGNSTASDLASLDRALARCRRMNVNTVMLPVYWDLIEPEEGRFDFSLVKGAIDAARANGIRLVFLWFGTWKNSMSCYAPGWVKRDTARFKRVRTSAEPGGEAGELQEIISPESAAARDADATAFAALMRWTRGYDSAERTVVMVQVENEVGMIPEARDHSELAERAYRIEVPDALLSRLGKGDMGPEVESLWERAGRREGGTWGEVFGREAQGEEVFTAWEIARYVEHVAAAGKREYPLPMFANAALIRAGYAPGRYPSGGPLPHLLEVWRAAAPSIDMICPDIYFPNFMEWCGRYVGGGNPLFIPEMAASARAAGNAVHAVGRFGAMGVGPFSIENVDADRERQIADCYGGLGGMSDVILQAQRTGAITSLSPQIGFDWSVDQRPQVADLGGVRFQATFDCQQIGRSGEVSTLPTLGSGRWDAPPGTPLGSAMIIQLGPDEFVIFGMGVVVTFAPTDGKGKIGIDRVQEGHYSREATWVGGRWINGDETHQGRHVHLYDGKWTAQRVWLYRY